MLFKRTSTDPKKLVVKQLSEILKYYLKKCHTDGLKDIIITTAENKRIQFKELCRDS